MIEISVVIPVYGCRSALEELHSRLTATLSSLTPDYEIILVNDACPQDSWSAIEKIAEQDHRVIGINFSRNFGQSKAITAGLDHASGEYTVVMDCDLQDEPEEITKLYNKAKEGYDIVFAKRMDRKDSAFKKNVSRLFYFVFEKLSGYRFDPDTCNFSISSRKVREAFCNMREYHREYALFICWMGFKQTSIEVDTDYRKDGESSYTLAKKLRLAEDILTSQSDALLRFTSYAGVIITLISLLYIVFLIIQYFVVPDMEMGWTSVIATITLMGGLILFAIGIVGIYIGKIFMQSKNRPLYIISDIKNKEI